MGNTFTLISLFTGAGGLDTGFRLTNRFRVEFSNDILHHVADTYCKNHERRIIDVKKETYTGLCPVYVVGNVEKINFDDISCTNPDVLIGGPPCQDFSVMRGPDAERKGIKVKRGKQYSHFIRALIHLKPKMFVFENVPGIKSANNGAAYKTILSDFRSLSIRWSEIRKIVGNGYNDNKVNYTLVFSDVVDSADFGVPQRRKRIIIIGVRDDLIDNKFITSEEIAGHAENVLSGNGTIFKKYPMTPIEVFEGKALTDLDAEYKEIMKKYAGLEKKVTTKKAKAWEKEWKKLRFDIVEDYKTLNGIVGTKTELKKAMSEHRKILRKMGYYRRSIDSTEFSDVSQEIVIEGKAVVDRMKHIPPHHNYSFVYGTKWNVEGKGFSLIYRRLHPIIPSYTIVAKGGGGTLGYHYQRNRSRLTNRERARIQTFPDTYIFSGEFLQVRSQIGEAVPPLLGEKIADVVTTILEKV